LGPTGFLPGRAFVFHPVENPVIPEGPSKLRQIMKQKFIGIALCAMLFALSSPVGAQQSEKSSASVS
jgi:hypothetical protein